MTRLFAAFALACCATFAYAQEMKPGLWEIATTMKMQGMEMPGGKYSHCYTAKDIAEGKQYKMDEKSKCAIANLKSAGGNISYDMNCNMDGGVKLNGTVKGAMAATTFNFEQKMRTTPNQGMGEVHSFIKGRRLGDCK